jgi:ribosomal protein L40E
VQPNSNQKQIGTSTFCSNCGQRNNATANFCRSCGSRLSHKPQQLGFNSHSTTSTTTQAQVLGSAGSGQIGKKIPILIGVLCLALAILVLTQGIQNVVVIIAYLLAIALSIYVVYRFACTRRLSTSDALAALAVIVSFIFALYSSTFFSSGPSDDMVAYVVDRELLYVTQIVIEERLDPYEASINLDNTESNGTMYPVQIAYADGVWHNDTVLFFKQNGRWLAKMDNYDWTYVPTNTTSDKLRNYD